MGFAMRVMPCDFGLLGSRVWKTGNGSAVDWGGYFVCVGCVCGGFSMLSDRRVRGGCDAPSQDIPPENSP